MYLIRITFEVDLLQLLDRVVNTSSNWCSKREKGEIYLSLKFLTNLPNMSLWGELHLVQGKIGVKV